MADTNGVKEEPKVEAETATEEVKQSTPDVDMQDEQEGAEMEDGEGEEAEAEDKDAPRPQVPQTTTKDRTLKEFLGMMDQYAPIVSPEVFDSSDKLMEEDSRCSHRLLSWSGRL